MFFESSFQRIRVGASNSVISNSRLVVMPASLTVLAYTVPTPGGPSVVFAISWTRGLNLGSFSPSARNANTSSIGLSITVVTSKRPAMGLLSQGRASSQRPNNRRTSAVYAPFGDRSLRSTPK